MFRIKTIIKIIILIIPIVISLARDSIGVNNIYKINKKNEKILIL